MSRYTALHAAESTNRSTTTWASTGKGHGIPVWLGVSDGDGSDSSDVEMMVVPLVRVVVGRGHGVTASFLTQ